MNNRIISIILILLILLTTSAVAVYAIEFRMQDSNGVHYYYCDGFAGEPIRVKIVEKNTYKVLGSYVGKIVIAPSAFKAAQIVCGENPTDREKSDK